MNQDHTPKLDQRQKLSLYQDSGRNPTKAHGERFVEFDKDLQTFVVREIFNSQVNRKVTIDDGVLYQKIEDIRGISLSLAPINNFSDWDTYDGTTHGFSYSNGTWGISLSWGSDYPPEWQPIVKWFDDFMAWLLSELDKGSMQRIEKP